MTDPEDTPETMPVELPTVAIPVAPLLQVPPPVLLVSVVTAPTQSVEEPEIVPAAGKLITVTATVVVAVPQDVVVV